VTGDVPGRPVGWLEEHFAAAFPDHQPISGSAADAERPHGLLTCEELTGGVLRELRDEMVGLGTPAAAAGMYLAGWYGGLTASFVGFALVGSDAGFLLSRNTLRWWVHPDGYADALEPGDNVTAVVLPGHPWSGRADTVTVVSRAEQAALTTESLVAVVSPLVNALQDLTRTGRVGLWHEVADALGGALVYQQTIPVTEDACDLLRGLLSVPGTPWKRRPRIDLVSTDSGLTCVTHKGGCCLAYTDTSEADHAEDEDHRAFQNAFPDRRTRRPTA